MTVKRKLALTYLLVHLLIAGVGSGCLPASCLKCYSANAPCVSCSTNVCANGTLSSNCTEFQVTVNSSNSSPKEGEYVTLTCVHNLFNVSLYGWIKNGIKIPLENKSTLVLSKVQSIQTGSYNCFVNSSCGSFESPPYNLNVPNQSVLILVVCGVGALLLVVIMGLAMKLKLKRDNARHKERRKQREQVGRSGGPAPFTPRET